MPAHLQTFALEGNAPDKAWFASMVAETFIDRAPGGSTWSSFAGKGGMHRCGVLVDLHASADTSPDVTVLDSEIDWRDRFLVVFARVVERTSSEDSIVPGGGFDGTDGTYKVRFGYTRLGEDEGASQSSASDGHIVIYPDVSIYAQASGGAGNTGELKLEITDNPTWARVTIWLYIVACELIGEQVTAAAVPVPGVSEADGSSQIEPRYMNALQDGTILTQLRQGQMTVAAEQIDPSAVPTFKSHSDAWPLGPVGSGIPRVPTILKVSSRGPLIYPGQTNEIRQNVAGSIRTCFSKTCAVDSDQVLDTRYDWRDRLVIFLGASHTTDIRPGGAAEDTLNGSGVNAGGQFPSVGYLGPGGTGHAVYLSTSKNTYLYADASNGNLRIKATASESAQQYVAGILIATFQFGPHS